MAKDQCKYSTERLVVIVSERGITAAIEDIKWSAIADPSLRELWRHVQDRIDALEERLTQ